MRGCMAARDRGRQARPSPVQRLWGPEDCPGAAGPEIAPSGLLVALSGRPEGDARHRSRNRVHPCYG